MTYNCGTGRKNKKRTKSEARFKAEGLVDLVHSYSGLRVFTNALFEEICFPLEANRRGGTHKNVIFLNRPKIYSE